MSKLLHPGNSWKLLKREAMRLFLLWYAALGEQAGDQVCGSGTSLTPVPGARHLRYPGARLPLALP